MRRTVGLVVVGATRAARAAAVDALRRGRSVLFVLRSGDATRARRLRNGLCRAANVDLTQVSAITNADIVCVDGVDGVEAVVVRYTRTGRLCGVNTQALWSCGDATPPVEASEGGPPTQ